MNLSLLGRGPMPNPRTRLAVLPSRLGSYCLYLLGTGSLGWLAGWLRRLSA